MTGQGPAVPLSKYIQMQQTSIYQNMGSGIEGALQHSRIGVLHWRITNLGVCTCGHETQPPKKGGQYEICTEHVKHVIQWSGRYPK